MEEQKRKQLEDQGWKIGDATDFLDLTSEEGAYIELRLRLSEEVRRMRLFRQLTQAQLARMITSSQSRIAKVEAADPSVSLDLLIRSLLAMGATHHDLAMTIEGKRPVA